jgi:Condensation domain
MAEWNFPASYAQERVWLANQLDPKSPVYNVSVPWRAPSGLDRDQIVGILAEVVRRHESLRTHLRADGGSLIQVVRAPEPFDLPAVDVRAAAVTERDRPVAEIASEMARTAIPLDRPPLWRAKLARAGEADWWLLFVVHHAVFDSRSLVVFRDELDVLSRAALTGTPADLPELRIQYADFAAW